MLLPLLLVLHLALPCPAPALVLRLAVLPYLICFLQLDHDLGRTIDKFTVTKLRDEFQRAAAILANERQPMALLFQKAPQRPPYPAAPPSTQQGQQQLEQPPPPPAFG